MRKISFVSIAILSTVILLYSFKPASTGKQIMTIRVTNQVQTVWDDDIWISKPGEVAKKAAALENFRTKNNEKNLTTVTNFLNQQSADGWELFNVTSAGLGNVLVVTYTFTK
jgi:hypothetical protein